MKCEKCIAYKSFFDGIEERAYCEIGISEDEAYHDGKWHCRYNQKTIGKKLRNKNLKQELNWGNPYISKDLIDYVAQSGINTIRIPVTWYYNTGVDENGNLICYFKEVIQ